MPVWQQLSLVLWEVVLGPWALSWQNWVCPCIADSCHNLCNVPGPGVRLCGAVSGTYHKLPDNHYPVTSQDCQNSTSYCLK
ncbi:hypothetical protein H920_07007 [Fukomys damarensis]|uniref:Uncharacterized protein n=1 Tax=Fukomys damarensis TaxID=885580 RepID=A0A091E8V9_FUKDA|nr:hypothetical protein H920_07007 [Fukomys damarensis]